ncbi:MAG: FGGY-family carbohydrate kinase [Thermomicrobiales bacterium]
MAGDLLLGVDIGTYSSKGVICRPNGEVVATATIEHDLLLPKPGWAEHDPDATWWGEFVGLTRQMLAQGIDGGAVGAVAVSGIGACLLPVDANGNALRNGILYGIDTRASEEIAWLNRHFGEEPMFDFGGMALTSQAIGPKILWLKNHEPDVYERAHMMLAASSFIVQKLTGEFVMDHHTASYYNPLYDLRGNRWDPRFAGPIVDLARLPKLLWANEVAGQVTPIAAAVTGLTAGIPVTAGTIDAAAEAISVGVIDAGDMMVMYGTTMFFIHVTGDPVPDARMWSTAYLLPGMYSIDGGMSTTGALTRWFRDTLGGLEMAAEAAGGPNAYAALADLAAAVPPGSDGLICLPYFAGERTPINDPDARGMYVGLTLIHTRGHLYRASLEGTAYGVRHNLETMEGMGALPKRLVAVGGGAKNPLWLQIVSDVSGLPQDVPEKTIGASYGDAFLAGLATGIVPSLDNLRRDWVKPAATYRPRPDQQAIYARYYPVYRELYEVSKDAMHELARLGAEG